MPLPRTAPIADVPYDVVCKMDPAIGAIVFDFDAILEDMPAEPKYDLTEEDSQAAQIAYMKAIEAWEKQKANAIAKAFLELPAAAVLEVKLSHFKELLTEALARATVLELLDAARWQTYYEDGDIAALLDGAEDTGEAPTLFSVTQVAEPDKVHVVGRMQAGPTAKQSDYEQVYETYLWLLGRCLRDVSPWPEGWPDMKRKGKTLSQESLRLLPHAWVSSLGGYLLNSAQLRRSEKKE